jgi:drug/metabolite transporter (DMT)-like permease
VRLSRLDALLLLMAFIWGSNYSILKSALADVPPVAFNALRLLLASALFLTTIAIRNRLRMSNFRPGAWHQAREACQAVPGTDPGALGARHRGRDAWRLLALAIIGNTCYQLLFIWGLSATSASNSALIIGCTPVFVALMTAALGQEPIHRRRWIGVLLSAAGVYLVVGRGNPGAGDSIAGDILMLGSVACWALGTIVAKPLLGRWPAFEITGLSMALGTIMYLPFALPDLSRLQLASVTWQAWGALVFSASLALYVAYAIWFTAVQRLGGPRTAVYSNMVPVAGLLVASLGFGEQIGVAKGIGAAIVLLGVGLTRL